MKSSARGGKTAVKLLCVLVALATIFALILPALTLDRETANAEAGLSETESSARLLMLDGEVPLDTVSYVSYGLYLDGTQIQPGSTAADVLITEGNLRYEISWQPHDKNVMAPNVVYTYQVDAPFDSFEKDVVWDQFPSMPLFHVVYDSASGVMRITFYDNESGRYWTGTSGTNASVAIEGVVDFDNLNDRQEITIGGETYSFTPKPDTTVNYASVSKSAYSTSSDAEGRQIQTFRITVTGYGINPSAVLTDSMGEYLTLIPESIKVRTGSSTSYPEADSSKYSIDETSERAFQITFPNLNQPTGGDPVSYYVFYDAIVDSAASTLSSTYDSKIRNDAYVSSNGTTNHDWAYATITLKQWIDKTGQYYPQGSDEYPAGTPDAVEGQNAILWTIDINTTEPQQDISGMTVRDSLPYNADYISGTAQFLVAPFGTDDWSEYSAQSDIRQQLEAEGEFSYTFPNGSDQSYRILFWTHPTEQVAEVNNTAYLDDHSDTESVNPANSYDDLVQKYCMTTGNTATTVTWKVVLHGSKSGFEQVTLNDLIPTGMQYVDGTAKIVADETDSRYDSAFFNVSSDDFYTAFTIGTIPAEDASVDNAGIVTIQFDTEIMDPPTSDRTYSNYAYMQVAGVDLDYGTASYTYRPSDVIVKSGEYVNGPEAYISGVDSVVYANGLIRWNIELRNLDLTDVESVQIIDTLGEGQTLFRPTQNNRFKISYLMYYKNGYWTRYQTVYDNPSGSNEYFTVEERTGSDGKQQVVFTLTEAAIQNLKDTFSASNRPSFTFYTIPTGMQPNTENVYVNDADAVINGENAGHAHATVRVTTKNNDILSKEGKHDAESEFVSYAVRINPKALDLSDGDELAFKDTLGEGLRLLPQTVKVYAVTIGENGYATSRELDLAKLNFQYEISEQPTYQDFDSETWSYTYWYNSVMSMTVPDETALVITYQAKITPPKGGYIDQNDSRYSNAAELSGYKITNNPISGNISGAGGDASGDTYKFNISKLDQDLVARGLNYAQFHIQGWKFVEQTDSYGTVNVGTSPDAGLSEAQQMDKDVYTDHDANYGDGFTEPILVLPNVIYKITEVSAPTYSGSGVTENYVLNSEPQFVLFLKPAEDMDYDTYADLRQATTVVMDGKEYPLSVYSLYAETMVIENQKLPAVTISKTVVEKPEDYDPDTIFTFEIMLNDANGNPVSGSFECIEENSRTKGTVRFTNGVGSVQLKDGESIRIVNLPVDGQCVVTEASVAGGCTVTNVFRVSGNTSSGTGNSTGVINLTSDAFVEFTNDLSVKLVSLKLIKTNVDGTQKLADAEFALYRLEDIVNGEPKPGAEAVKRGFTNASGEINWNDIEPGDYFLVETKAPTGFVERAGVEIHLEKGVITSAPLDNSVISDTEFSVTVPNNTGHQLPETGGIGSAPFMIGGSALILFAAVAFVVSRKRRNHA